MDLIGKIINDKYSILENLGEGGMSLVYKALDVENNVTVAVKLMKDRVTSAYMEDIIRFKREIGLVSKVNHPNIVKIYDNGEYENRPYIVMELLEGESLQDLLHKGAVFSVNSSIDIIRQLTKALNHVHGRGIIHRDLKPGNVVILGSKDKISIKLLDFGVAHIMELEEIKGEKEIVGTFGYMSPEVTGVFSGSVDERSDLYSMGVIFYQLLTGELPFKETELGRLLHQQAAYVPLKPGKIRDGIPAVLEDIIMKLLMKDPDLRYQSAKGLLYDIERYKHGEREFTAGEKDQKIKLTYRTRLVGREDETEKITGLFKKAGEGKGSVCFISGEAGTGKSRLVEEFRGYAYRQDALFISGRCLNHESKTPYQPFKDAIDEYIRTVEKADDETRDREIDRLRSIAGDLGEILARLNPRIKKLIGETKELISLEPERENQRFLMVLSAFFCTIVGRTNVCTLVLDDLQWADEGSLCLLREIMGRIDKSNLLVIGTYRDNEVGEGHGLERIIQEAEGKEGLLEEIKLSKLDYSAIRKLAANILGEKDEKITHLSGYLMEKSEGNPFFAINMLRELVEDGIVEWKGGSWHEKPDRLKNMPVSGSMVDVILKKISKLDKVQNELLCKAAIIGREFDMSLLYGLMDCEKEKVVVIVDDAISMQFLEKSSGKGRLLFAHDRIRDAFFIMMDDEERRRIHLEIARVIEKMYKDGMDKVVFELAHHYSEAGDRDKSLEYVIPAADKARLSYANEEAVRYYKTVMRLLEEKGCKGGDGWVKASSNLADVHLTMSRNAEAIAVSEGLLSYVDTPLDKARVYKKIGAAYYKQGDWGRCEDNLAKGLELLGKKIPMRKVEVILSIMAEAAKHVLYEILPWAFYKKGGLEDREEDKEIFWLYRGLALMYIMNDMHKFISSLLTLRNFSQRRISSPKERGLGLGAYGMALAAVPLFSKALKCLREALRIGEASGDEPGIAQSLLYMSNIYSWAGMHPEAKESCEKALLKYKRIGDIFDYNRVLHCLGHGYYYTSYYKKSIECYSRFQEVSENIKDVYGMTMPKTELAYCYIELGEFCQADKLLKEALTISESNSIWFAYCYATIYSGYLNLEKNDYQKAIEFFEKAKKLYKSNKFVKDPTILLFPHLADAVIKRIEDRSCSVGKEYSKEEIRYAGTLCKEALKRTKPWANHYGGALRAAANYYALAGKNMKAEKYFLKSIEHTTKINRRYEIAKGFYEYGRFLESLGRRNEAVDSWQKAYSIFDDIGAKVYIKRCETLLGIDDIKEERISEMTARDRLKDERRMNTVLDTGRYISSILDIDELLEKIMESVMELVGAERGILLLYPEEGGRKLDVKVVRNVSGEEVQIREKIISQSIISRMENEKTPLLISDALSDEQFKNKSSVIVSKVKSVICAPIMAKGEMKGVIYLDNSLLSGLFSEDDLKVLDVIASQAGVSIENARLYTRLKVYSEEIGKSRDEIAKWSRMLEQRVMERTEELNSKNAELASMIEQLQEHSKMIEDLAISKERNRFALDVHDTLGHTMTLLIKLLEVGRMNCESPDTMIGKMDDAIKIAREGLKELRRSIKGLSPEKLETNDLVSALEELAADFQTSQVKIDFSVEGSFSFRSPLYSYAIYNICREALTNSLRHGKAENVTIILKLVEGEINLVIIDDGCGCKDITKGFGLSGMEQRVKNMDGKISFASDGESGFIIRVGIPLAGGKND